MSDDAARPSTSVHAETKTGERRLPTRRVNLTVFIASAVIVVAFAVWALAAPAAAESTINDVRDFITRWFGWWYFILATAIVGLVVFLGLSKYGRYRLGPEESRPEYSLFTWTAG